jgi:hypothetical protein
MDPDSRSNRDPVDVAGGIIHGPRSIIILAIDERLTVSGHGAHLGPGSSKTPSEGVDSGSPTDREHDQPLNAWLRTRHTVSQPY